MKSKYQAAIVVAVVSSKLSRYLPITRKPETYDEETESDTHDILHLVANSRESGQYKLSFLVQFTICVFLYMCMCDKNSKRPTIGKFSKLDLLVGCCTLELFLPLYIIRLKEHSEYYLEIPTLLVN